MRILFKKLTFLLFIFFSLFTEIFSLISVQVKCKDFSSVFRIGFAWSQWNFWLVKESFSFSYTFLAWFVFSSRSAPLSRMVFAKGTWISYFFFVRRDFFISFVTLLFSKSFFYSRSKIPILFEKHLLPFLRFFLLFFSTNPLPLFFLSSFFYMDCISQGPGKIPVNFWSIHMYVVCQRCGSYSTDLGLIIGELFNREHAKFVARKEMLR